MPIDRTRRAVHAAQPSRSRWCRESPRAHRSRRSRAREPASSRRGVDQQRHRTQHSRSGCRYPMAGVDHAARSHLGERSTRAQGHAAASTSSSPAHWEKPPADGRPNSPGVRQLLAYAQQLISSRPPRRAGTPSRQPRQSRLPQLSGGGSDVGLRRRAPRGRGRSPAESGRRQQPGREWRPCPARAVPSRCRRA